VCTQICTLHGDDTSSTKAKDSAVNLVTVQQLRSKRSKTRGTAGLVKALQAGWWDDLPVWMVATGVQAEQSTCSKIIHQLRPLITYLQQNQRKFSREGLGSTGQEGDALCSTATAQLGCWGIHLHSKFIPCFRPGTPGSQKHLYTSRALRKVFCPPPSSVPPSSTKTNYK